MALTDDVIDAIKDMILRGELKPGDRLPIESVLASQLGVSRNSLREGVRSLNAMGVLEARQGAGTYVTSLDVRLLFAPMEFIAELDHHDPRDFLQVRRALECEAAAQAARRIDADGLARLESCLDAIIAIVDGGEPRDHEALLAADEAFHQVIARASGNLAMAALLEIFTVRTWRLRALRSESEIEAGEAAVREHGAILDALRTGDPEQARAVMYIHLVDGENYARRHSWHT